MFGVCEKKKKKKPNRSVVHDFFSFNSLEVILYEEHKVLLLVFCIVLGFCFNITNYCFLKSYMKFISKLFFLWWDKFLLKGSWFPFKKSWLITFSFWHFLHFCYLCFHLFSALNKMTPVVTRLILVTGIGYQCQLRSGLQVDNITNLGPITQSIPQSVPVEVHRKSSARLWLSWERTIYIFLRIMTSLRAEIVGGRSICEFLILWSHYIL